MRKSSLNTKRHKMREKRKGKIKKKMLKWMMLSCRR
jgi:hypothetical protein